MRSLCLVLPKNERPSLAENFLSFSPRVYYRSPGLIFMDVSQSARKYGGERLLLNELQDFTSELFPDATAAVADTPAVAQAFSRIRPFQIVPPQSESTILGDLPLDTLVHLEGLIAWRTTQEVEDVIDFFYSLGLKKIADIQKFSLQRLRKQFGDLGEQIWRRIHGFDKQLIAQLTQEEPVQDQFHLGLGISLLPLILHVVEQRLQKLLLKVENNHRLAGKIILQLHCEYSDRYHLVEVTPKVPTNELAEVLRLVESQLSEIDFENPVRQISIDVIPAKKDQPVSKRGKESARVTSGFLRANFSEDERLLIGNQSVSLRTAKEPSHTPRTLHFLDEPETISSFALARLRIVQRLGEYQLESLGVESSRGRDYSLAMTPDGERVLLFFDHLTQEHYLYGQW